MKKKALAQIAFEFISIVFAVLLALGLNSYKQSIDLKNESELLEERILKECEINLMNIDSVIRQNEEFQEYMDSLLAADEIEGFQFNYSNELLSSIAWNFTKTSRSFSYMDPDFLARAAEVYEIQDYYMQISNQMFDHLGEMILQIDNINPRTLTLTGNYYLENLIGSSKDLRANYQEFLSEYRDGDTNPE